MHVIQQIAVSAESVDEAFNKVKDNFDNSYSESEGLGGWSDWYVVGGGRWNSNPSNQYQDSTNDVIEYSSNPIHFMDTLNEFLAYRVSEMERLAKQINLEDFGKAVEAFTNGTNTDTDRFDMNLWYVKKASELMSGIWNSDSAFYDLDNYSTTPKYMLEDIDKGNKNWYLVPVDFHF
jgi:hypothetical protein